MKFRLRLGETVTVLCVIVLAVAAAWPALSVAFGLSGTAGAATQSPGNPTASPPGYTPPAPSTSDAPPVTLTVLAPNYGARNDQTFWDQTVQDFHARNPRITVNVKLVDRSALVPEARGDLAAGSVDLVLGASPSDVPAAAADGRLYRQSDLAGAGMDFLPGFDYREEGTGPDGNPMMFGIPFTGSTLALYCNMSVFMNAGVTTGPPSTWAELAADAAKIKASGKIGYGLAMAPADAATTAEMWMNAGGGRGFGSSPGNRGWSVNMPVNVNALRWLDANLVKPGRTEPHPERETTQDLAQQFAADKIGMMVADSTLLPRAQDAGLGTAVQVVPMPGLGGSTTATVASVEDFLASTAHPEHKDAITKFLAAVLSSQNTTWFADIHGTLPLTQAGVDLESRTDPALQPFLNQLTQVLWLPTLNPAWPTVQNAIATELSMALTGDPQPILDKIQAVAMAASPKR